MVIERNSISSKEYIGILAWELKKVTTGDREGDKLVFFQLVPANNIFNDFEIEAADPVVEWSSLSKLREQVQKRIVQGNTSYTPKLSYREYGERSALVKAYALLRARDTCELCDISSPFISTSGVPFLEVHHILKLTDKNLTYHKMSLPYALIATGITFWN